MNDTTINQVFNKKILLKNKQIQYFIIPLHLRQKRIMVSLVNAT